MRSFDGVSDSSNKTKYMNYRNTTSRNRGLSKSNYISDRNKINHNSIDLKNVKDVNVRQ